MRVNWILVGAGFFAIYYPITALMFRVIPPAHRFMPDWLFAGTQAVSWTLLLISMRRDRLRNHQPIRAAAGPTDSTTLKIAVRHGAIALAAGVVARLLVGRPSWIEVVGYAIVAGLSIKVSNVLVAASGLSVPEKRESQ